MNVNELICVGKTKESKIYKLTSETSDEILVCLPKYAERRKHLVLLDVRDYNMLLSMSGRGGMITEHVKSDKASRQKESDCVAKIQSLMRQELPFAVGQLIYEATGDVCAPTEWMKQEISAIRAIATIGECEGDGENNWSVQYLDKDGKEIGYIDGGCGRCAFGSFEELKEDTRRKFINAAALWNDVKDETD